MSTERKSHPASLEKMISDDEMLCLLRGIEHHAKKSGKSVEELCAALVREHSLDGAKEDTARSIVCDLVAASDKPSGPVHDVVDFMVELTKIVARARVWMKAEDDVECAPGWPRSRDLEV